MQKVINHPTYGQIIYEESAWTGKRTLTLNGTVANKIAKNIFSLNGMQIVLKGNATSGLVMLINGENIELYEKTAWYEWALSIIPFIFLLTWGNSVELCKIFPVVGGAIGGAIGGVAIIASIACMKLTKKPIKKVLIGLGVAVAAILVAYLIALMIISSYR